MVEVDAHYGLAITGMCFHSVRIAPDQKTSKPQLTGIGLEELTLGRWLGWKFQRFPLIDHDCIDNKLIIADAEPDWTPDIAKCHDRLDGLLNGEFDPADNVPARSPNAGIALDETDDAFRIGSSRINRHFHCSANADPEE